MKITVKKVLVFVLLLIVVCSYAACSSAGHDAGPGNNDGSGFELIVNPNGDRKFIYTVNAQIESNDITQSVDKVMEKVLELEGYVERSDIYTDSKANLFLRIRTDKVNQFLGEFSEFGKVKSQTTVSEDITLEYIDVEAELEALDDQIDYTETLIAETTNQNQLRIYNDELRRLKTERYAIQLRLDNLDNLVQYSKVTITIIKTGSGSVGEVFDKSLNVFLTALTYVLYIIVAIAPFATPCIAAYFIYKFVKKRKAAAKAKQNVSIAASGENDAGNGNA